jgi:hypothetical protein
MAAENDDIERQAEKLFVAPPARSRGVHTVFYIASVIPCGWEEKWSC